ncbi:zinc-binding domain-containing [Pyrenophora seminiperda CCB06]|uniref:Zinc-binding domain-containing n=1 Tax=Pyrenophora seminiperda CCB06 TaxID=1302712 RepID=A0A3M7MB86_9PLEO|nr:zinc-binding domain-containing [Pyrenophora seminiperda CCB06]
MDYCVHCSRYFASNEALKQHKRDSPVHNRKVHCQTCDCFFSTKEALEQHQKNLARMSVSGNPPPITTRSQIAKEVVPKPTQETREFFTFPKLHPDVVDAVSPELPLIWFNEDEDDDSFCHEYFTHVMGKFMCNNNTCKKLSWSSRKVPIEIRGYFDNGYSAIVYNQRCKSCDRLGTFELNERSYIERVAYRLKKWAGVEMEAPPFDKIEGRPHEQSYCEGCKRGKCREGEGVKLY